MSGRHMSAQPSGFSCDIEIAEKFVDHWHEFYHCLIDMKFTYCVTPNRVPGVGMEIPAVGRRVMPAGTQSGGMICRAVVGVLNGLPPTFLSIAALDLLIEEQLDYARRLACAGAQRRQAR